MDPNVNAMFRATTILYHSWRFISSTIESLILHPSESSEYFNLQSRVATLHQNSFCLFCVMGRLLSVVGSSLVSLASPELGSLGLSLEKEHRSKVSDGVGVDGGRSEIPFFFAGFCGFPMAEDRDNRQQLPGNVQRTLKWKKETKMRKTKKNKENNNKEEKRKREKNEKRKQKKSAKTRKCKYNRETQKNENSLQPHLRQSH